MEILNDGHAAVGVEAASGIFRVLDAVPADNNPRPHYTTVGSWTRVSGNVIKFHAFAGSGMTIRHVKLILRWALGHGYRLAYLDRLPGHVFPTAVRMTDGDFHGWWRLDLVETRLLRRKTVLSEN